MDTKVKTPFEKAAYMLKVLRGCKVTVNELLCKQMQVHSKETFKHLCNIVGSPEDYKECAKNLNELGTQPLID